VTTVPEGRKLANYRFGDNAYYYLDKMVDLCRDNDIDLVLVKAPSLYPYWYDEWEAQIEEYAAKHDLLYINFLELIDEIGIDFNTDTYDGGLHMNLSGAEKLSVYLGKVLAENYGLKDHRNDDVYKEVWEEKVDFYYDMKAQQYYELEKYGYLKSFGAKPPTS
ncbi:MAG TPA: SGNH/GDSL hydrolase family protein, partial [Candidatus Atribacteria bacterium]|nr:SGNH/GDSL hydrolase family protein [Candidatus Atribacteria bacterium]